jgi:transcriptional regulator with XRE-family HTH domain
MKISDQLVDSVVLTELGARLARARLERGLKQVDLATQAGIAKRTLERMEAGVSTELRNLVRVCRVLGLLERFDLLLPEPTPGPVEQASLRGRERKRVRTGAKTEGHKGSPDTWHWADES